MAAPLALKRQRARNVPRRENFSHFAEVVVDNGIFHLDETFTYGISDELLQEIHPGSLVKVSFRGKPCFGIVWEVTQRSTGEVKPISAIVDPNAVSPSVLKVIDELRKRYACSRHDLIRFAITKRRREKALELADNGRSDGKVRFEFALPYETLEEQVARLITESQGVRIVIADTQRNMLAISNILTKSGVDHLVLNPELGSKEYAAIQAQSKQIDSGVVLGLRSLIFGSFSRIDQIFILNEASQHHYEIKAPRWNTRDVGLTRQRIEGFSLTFISASPSLELFRLIDSGAVKANRAKRGINFKRSRTFASPASHLEVIRNGLKHGCVLVSVAEKEYVEGVICNKCKTVAKCSCGGKFRLNREKSLICVLCQATKSTFTCAECGEHRFLMARRGALRIAEELGKAFPGTLIQVATADKALRLDSAQHSIVISTAGVEPRIANGYSALILLDGEFLVNVPLLRAEEDLLARWSALLLLIQSEAPVFVSLPQSHLITQSLMARDPLRFLRSQLQDRESLHMPPNWRLIRINGDTRTLNLVRANLISEFAASIEILPVTKDGKLIIKSPHGTAALLLHSLRVLQKYRSASKKELLRIEVDPREI